MWRYQGSQDNCGEAANSLIKERGIVVKLSARNQFKGSVDHVTEGAVNGVVTIKLGADAVKADITMEAIEDLGLRAGQEATAVIKATSVLIAAGTSTSPDSPRATSSPVRWRRSSRAP